MGNNFATELADNELFSELDLETSIGIHLSANHYPPVPKSMIQPCIDAIDAYWSQDTDQEIQMPEGVTYKGRTTAPAWAIIEAHHLEAWLQEE
jgi:hypothetical protein